MVVQRPAEPVSRHGRDLTETPTPAPPPLTVQDLVPHLRGLARALREQDPRPPDRAPHG
ncbi:hypothetical protein DFP74_3428 [Nocardiopsis sp. Huas11]|uniref:hypothetical protein n=1 Tax=Nocardiopsis sp. Huas11 TaxID=2183912 RepID=UPI000F223C2E|nr:hypothetical protein [Nocardiopsis sp. Huas11]RKS07744.1 hypothetical protein DFP74_3428 [Nocardiopsis sp. Huas11]